MYFSHYAAVMACAALGAFAQEYVHHLLQLELVVGEGGDLAELVGDQDHRDPARLERPQGRSGAPARKAAPRLHVGDEHGARGREYLRRLRHKPHAAERDHIWPPALKHVSGSRSITRQFVAGFVSCVSGIAAI